MISLAFALALLSLVVRGEQVRAVRHFEHPEDVSADFNVASGQLDISFRTHGRAVTLRLRQAAELLHTDALVGVHGHGELMSVDRLKSYAKLSYRGTVVDSKGTELGWARLTLHGVDELDKFTGVMQIDGDLYHIVTTSNYMHLRRRLDKVTFTNKHKLVIYRESDNQPVSGSENATATHSCGFDITGQVQKDLFAQLPSYQASESKLLKRDGSQSKCLATPMTLYMGVVADCSYVSQYGGAEKALLQIIADWNQASQLYQSTFNVALGIQRVDLQTTCDQSATKLWNQQCSVGYGISQRLSDFSQWRGTQNASVPLYHLMTRCGSGQTLGIAWLGTACQTEVNQQGGTYVTGAAVTSSSLSEWQTVAHEIGHNFAATHDCTSGCSSCSSFNQCGCASTYSNCPCCPCGTSGSCDCGNAYLMNPTSGGRAAQFSQCSQNQICNNKGAWSKCLSQPNALKQVTANVCGNGVKEPGEECDCGGADSDSCRNQKCCNGATCKLTTGSQCADVNDKCCTNCQINAANTTCRASRGPCDIAEQCSGTSGDCPSDLYLQDLTSCSIPSTQMMGQCASGECTSRDYQCVMRNIPGVTGECPGYSNQCGIYCQSQQQLGACVGIGGATFIDGTPCSQNGQCRQGSCDQSGWSAFVGFLTVHNGTFIVLGVVAAVFLSHMAYKYYQQSQKRIKLAGKSTRPQMESSYTELPQETDVLLPETADIPQQANRQSMTRSKKAMSLKINLPSSLSTEVGLASARLSALSPLSPVSARTRKSARPLSQQADEDSDDDGTDVKSTESKATQ